MSTAFDPEQGLLRLRHGALAVLALLASDPTSTRLHDHAVAPVLTELRAAGLLGRSGIHPVVAPLAETVARSGTTAEIAAADHGTPHHLRVWVGRELAVVGSVTGSESGTYELLADHPRQLPDVLSELLGLAAGPDPPVPGRARLSSEDFDMLLDEDAWVTGAVVAAALGLSQQEPWVAALTAGLRGAGVRWRLRAHRSGSVLGDMTVLDARLGGLWVARREGAEVTVEATQAAAVRAELANLLT